MLYRFFVPLVPAALLTLATAPAWAADPLPNAGAPLAPRALPAPAGFRYPEARRESSFDTPQAPRWYGWQTLVVVVPSQLLFFLGTTSNTSGATIAGALGHVATAPIVHWVHGNIGRGFVSLALNAGLPYLGLVAAITSNSDTGIGLAIASIVVWPALDIALLHYDEPRAAAAPKKETGGFDLRSFGVLPLLDRDKKGFSLVGRF